MKFSSVILLLAGIVLFRVPASPQGISPVPASYFGNMLNVSTHPWPTIPFGMLRLWDTHTKWADIETGRGVFNWSIFDSYMGLAAAHKVQLIYTLGQTPQWASSNPYGTCKTGAGQCYAPANMQDFANWGKAVAQHVKNWNAAHGANVVVYYELWNEPNGSFFLGTYAQLAQMSRVIGPAIKSVNPSALISTPANQGRYGYQGLDQFFSAGGISDFIAFHGYLWHVNGVLIWPDDPTWGIGDFVKRIRQVEALHGLNLPLWDTEHSFASITTDLTSKTEQANFVARFYLSEWQTGVRTSVWYGWDFYPNGTMWQSGTTFPDGIAAGTVYSWMTGATPQTITTSGSVLSMTLGLANGASNKAVWTRSGTASISTAGFTQYSDLNGNVRPITGSSITVSGSPILLISSATTTSVSVAPSDSTIAAGNTQQFAATAYYSDGKSGPVQASWKSSDPNVATISSSGLCTGAAAGIATISATYLGTTASTSIMITTAGSGATPPLPNPGFEQGSLYWAFNNSGSYSIVSGGAHGGNNYAVLNAPAGKHPVLFATDSNGNQYFPVAAGDVISFGGWASRASGDGQGRFKLAAYDANRANPVYIDSTPSNVTSLSWTQQTGTYTVTSGKSFVRIYCELFSNTVAASVAFDDVIFARSTPAP